MFKMQTGVWKSSTLIKPDGETIKKKNIISSYENNKVKIIKRATSIDPDAKVFKVFQKKINKPYADEREQNALKNRVKEIILKKIYEKHLHNKATAKSIVKSATKSVAKSKSKSATKPVAKSTTKSQKKKTITRKKTKIENK